MCNKNKILLILSITLSVFTTCTLAKEKDIDCTQLTVSEMQKALETKKVTSVQCVTGFLNRINALDPIDIPHVVPYTYTCGIFGTCTQADNITAYNALNTQFLGLNAFSSLNAQALAQAQQADLLRKQGDKRPLLGIPISIKDDVAVAGLGLTNAWGNFTYLAYQPAVSNDIIQNLINAGAIIIGKNTMSEFGLDGLGINFVFGPARNAYDQTRISGASTSGGSVAVAARLVPAVLGNDAGGSLRIPAALNGIIGYRPSYGRYANTDFVGITPPFPVPQSMGTNGWEARSIDDIVLLDSFTAISPLGKLKTSMKLKGLRLGVPTVFYQNLDPELQIVVNNTLSKLQQEGAVLVNTPDIPGLNPGINIPSLGFWGMLNTVSDVWTQRFVIIGHNIDIMLVQNIGLPIVPESPQGAATHFLFVALYSLAFPDVASGLAYYDYLLSLTNISLNNYRNYFTANHLDGIIYPTTRIPASTIQNIVVNGGNPITNGLYDFAFALPDNSISGAGRAYLQNTLVSPYLGTPSLSMPVGLTANTHLPVGMQIEGLPGDDAKILSIGSAFEKVFSVPAPVIAGGE